MTEEATDFLARQEHPNIYMDMDATLAQYSGWVGVAHIGDPYPGAKEFLASLKQAGARIVLYTARLNTNLNAKDWEELTGTKNQRQHLAAIIHIVKKWLEEHDLLQYIDDIAVGKPGWWVLIDDRCITHKGDYGETLKHIMEFKSWAQRDKPNPLSPPVVPDPAGETLLKNVKSKGGK